MDNEIDVKAAWLVSGLSNNIEQHKLYLLRFERSVKNILSNYNRLKNTPLDE